MVNAESAETPISDRLRTITDPKERAAVKVQEAVAVLADVTKDVEVTRTELVIKFQRAPQPVLDKQGNVIGIDALVRVYVGGVEQQVDAHRAVLNLPMLVPDGTFHDETDVITGEKRQVANFHEDPREAFLQVIEQSLRDVPNAAGWVK